MAKKSKIDFRDKDQQTTTIKVFPEKLMMISEETNREIFVKDPRVAIAFSELLLTWCDLSKPDAHVHNCTLCVA